MSTARNKKAPRKPAITKRTILTAVLIDPIGWSQQTPEEEYVDIVKTFKRELKPHTLNTYRVLNPLQIKVGTEMVIFDFGGMTSDLGFSNARFMVKWAEENPGSLFVVYSTFTYNHVVRPVLRDLSLLTDRDPNDWLSKPQPILPNIVLSLFGENLPEWFTGKAPRA